MHLPLLLRIEMWKNPGLVFKKHLDSLSTDPNTRASQQKAINLNDQDAVLQQCVNPIVSHTSHVEVGPEVESPSLRDLHVDVPRAAMPCGRQRGGSRIRLPLDRKVVDDKMPAGLQFNPIDISMSS